VYKYEPVMYICALHRPMSNSHVEGRVDLYRDTSTEDVWGHNTVRRTVWCREPGHHPPRPRRGWL